MPRTVGLTQEFIVEVPNEPGRLGELAQLLGKEDINILGFAAVARRDEPGTMHLITDDEKAAEVVLEEDGYAPRREEAVVATVPNVPGQLGRLATRLGEAGINIDASFVAVDGDEAMLRCVFAVDRPREAVDVLGE